jgi:hypothetical protein
MSLHDAPVDRRPAAAVQDAAVTAAITRLTTEFAGRIRPGLIAHTVVGAYRELAGSPRSALPELVERLARERLRQSTGIDDAAS